MNTTDSKTSLNYNQLTAEFDDFLTALRIALPNLKPGTILQNLSLEKVRRDQEIKNQQILVNQILKKMISWIAQKSSTTGLNMTRIAQKLALVLHPDKLSGNNSENGLYLKCSTIHESNEGFYFDNVRTQCQQLETKGRPVSARFSNIPIALDF